MRIKIDAAHGQITKAVLQLDGAAAEAVRSQLESLGEQALDERRALLGLMRSLVIDPCRCKECRS